MRGLIGGVIAAIAATAAPAAAEEMVYGVARPSGAPIYNPYGFYNWNGFYVGLNGGGHWGRDSDSSNFGPDTLFSSRNAATINAALPFNTSQTGFAGGGQVGFNWYLYGVVLGLEGDISSVSGTGTRNTVVSLAVPSQQVTLTDTVSDRWIATYRARFGYAFDRLLLYVTGGGAAANWSITHTYADNLGTGATSVQLAQTRYGYSAGAGLEYAIGASWSVRAEYLFASFGSVPSTLSFQTTPTKGATLSYGDSLTESIARAGINYKFGR